MIFDLSDPIGTVLLIGSILFLYEVVKILDSDDTGEHIQDRIEFYRGIIGKVGDGLGKIGAGMQKVLGLFSKKEKDQEDEKPGKVYQMEEPEEEDPFEGEGGIEG